MQFRHFASLDAPLPATYRELHHKEAAVTIPRLGPGQDAAMPPKDRHGKTAQDYRAALIAELDAVPSCRRHRKPQRSPLLLAWLLVRFAQLWLNPPKRIAGYISFPSKSCLLKRWTVDSRLLSHLDEYFYDCAITALSFNLPYPKQEIIGIKIYDALITNLCSIRKRHAPNSKHSICSLTPSAQEAS